MNSHHLGESSQTPLFDNRAFLSDIERVMRDEPLTPRPLANGALPLSDFELFPNPGFEFNPERRQFNTFVAGLDFPPPQNVQIPAIGPHLEYSDFTTLISYMSDGDPATNEVVILVIEKKEIVFIDAFGRRTVGEVGQRVLRPYSNMDNPYLGRVRFESIEFADGNDWEMPGRYIPL